MASVTIQITLVCEGMTEDEIKRRFCNHLDSIEEDLADSLDIQPDDEDFVEDFAVEFSDPGIGQLRWILDAHDRREDARDPNKPQDSVGAIVDAMANMSNEDRNRVIEILKQKK